MSFALLNHSLKVNQIWTGTGFEARLLADIGLRVQLGHGIGQGCKSPESAPQPFTVVHTNGVHRVNLNYCGCSDRQAAGSHVEQLIWHRWYPATTKSPQTCAMIAALQMYHKMSDIGKVSAFDWYHSIHQFTRSTGVRIVKV